MIDKSFWKGKKVLITGHTGFKGGWLALWLIELGAKVSGISLPPETRPSLFDQLKISSKLNNNYFEDIRNQSSLDELISNIKPDVAFHLAAQPLVRESYKDPLGTWTINVIGSLNVLQSLHKLNNFCTVIMITTDKVYKSKEWFYGYRENDQLGGFDPYSASKAACEIAIESWRSSFCLAKKKQSSRLAIATARSGNVIGGGDWSKDRIVPDAIRSLNKGLAISVRNPTSTRPWQHVLEPLSGYLILAEKLFQSKSNLKKYVDDSFASSFNFGPNLESNKKVAELVDRILFYWPGEWNHQNEITTMHETNKLYLNTDKSFHLLNWSPKWNFETTVKRTLNWYKEFYRNDISPYDLCLKDIEYYDENKK